MIGGSLPREGPTFDRCSSRQYNPHRHRRTRSRGSCSLFALMKLTVRGLDVLTMIHGICRTRCPRRDRCTQTAFFPGLGAKTLTARLGNPEDSAQLSHCKLKAALCHTDERQAIHPMLLRHGDTTAGPELHKYKHPNRHSDWHCHCTR